MIDESERADFDSELEKRSFDPEDFSVVESDRSEVRAGIFPIVGDALVTRKSTGASRTYQTGHGSSWITEFAADLSAGLFG